MSRLAVLLYGVVCYVVFFGVFLYLAGFLGNFWVPRGIDSPPLVPLGQALVVNLGLVALFGLQHTVMARPSFKQWWTRFVPKPIERPTYVMATNLALIAMFVLWQPMGGAIWTVTSPIGRTLLWGGFAGGFLIVLVSTFMINHFDLFGLRQVWLYFRGRPYTHIGFRTPGFYKHIRHPLYVGWFMTFWCTPTMTAAHLVLAAGLTLYILIAIAFEERNLVQFLPEYAAYRKRTPMFIPRPWRRPEPVEPAIAVANAETIATTITRLDTAGS